MWILLILVSELSYISSKETPMDAREGADVRLPCRFSRPSISSVSYFWIRLSKTKGHDNVAMKETPFDPNYKLDYHVEDGIYDLLISNASYERDDGRFECRVKVDNSGQNIHTQTYVLTILLPPQPPQIAPGTSVTAMEGKKQELTCSSVGGSPDPKVRWHREGSDYALEAALRNGGSKDQPTTATLTITPTKYDDNAIFICKVWNRALSPEQALISRVALTVHYFPRVTVGPANPLRVERDSSATLTCSVDAKPKVNSVRWMRNSRYINTDNNHLIVRVSTQDAGKYTCVAENGLGKVGEQELTLDVLFGPIVTLESRTREAELGSNVCLSCNVTANPIPISIKWLREDRPEFYQLGDSFCISEVTPEDSGMYICSATNIIAPSDQNGISQKREGNSSVTLLVRHLPGRVSIIPISPVVEGGTVTLSCTASPPGWPTPHYKWIYNGTENIIVSSESKYTIRKVNLAAEGTYICQVSNELGNGQVASVDLKVQQPPVFTSKLKSAEVKVAGDSNFSVFCTARGKPRPIVKWLKDNNELTADDNMFKVRMEHLESSSNGAVEFKSILNFSGKARPKGNKLVPSDRGVYTCSFENEVRSTNSTMDLKIEHIPIVVHQYNKAAFDLWETATVMCRVQAYPTPEFKWVPHKTNNPMQFKPAEDYNIQTTAEGDDYFTSIFKIFKLTKKHYGNYTCQVENSQGRIETKIRLQPKGPPEKPTNLVALYTGPNYVTLGWEPGFNGGIYNTKYFVSFKKIPGENQRIEGCGPVSKNSDWGEVDCQQKVPCDISSLDQHQTYLFKVKPLNSKGIGENSQEIHATTRVDKIPMPQKVVYDKSIRILSIKVPSTCLPLVAVIETMSNDNGPTTTWQVIDTLSLQVSGLLPKTTEVNLDKIMTKNFRMVMGRSQDDEPIGVDKYSSPIVRVKVCLKSHLDHCGEFVGAELGDANLLREASALSMASIIAIIVTIALSLIAAGILAAICRCKKPQHVNHVEQTKETEMNSVRPTIIPSNDDGEHLNFPLFQNQAPPPYHAPGLDNQAMDLQLVLDDQKALYAATQTSYGHYGQPRNDWNYLDAGYTTAIPGHGSVDSQDSLWQLKMASNSGPQYEQYGGHDDYAHFPHTQDPYAQVHKPKKRLESPAVYRDAPGLPDPYMEQIDEDKPIAPPQHMSLAYEESLESGYSTPNSRTRRVIREIIV